MDKSVTFTPEAIIASMKEFYDSILLNPKLSSLRTQIASALISGSLLATSPAMAEELKGEVSYTRFLEGIIDHKIERVRVSEDGKFAKV